MTSTRAVYSPTLLKDHVAVITGGGSGIGKGVASAMVRHGAIVVIVGRKRDRLESAAKEIASTEKGVCIAKPGDVRDYTTMENVMKEVMQEFGRLDIVVCGAAGNFLSAANGLSSNAFKTVVEIDLVGTFNTCRAAYPHLEASGGGVILNISATLHYKGIPMQSHASAAKAGVDALTQSLALEWGPSHIRVVGVAPGPIEDTEGMLRLMPDGMEQVYRESIPLKRFGKVLDIEHAALFLVSKAASYITGCTLVVDGASWFTDSVLAKL